MWNVATGKKLTVNKVKGHDYSKYTVASAYNDGSILLYENSDIEDVRDEDYF
jgi:hypothetical protein